MTGHIGQGNYNDAENDITLVKFGDDATALKAPIGFWEIWNDAGSGADLDGAVLRPNCPSGEYNVMHAGSDSDG